MIKQLVSAVKYNKAKNTLDIVEKLKKTSRGSFIFFIRFLWSFLMIFVSG